MRYESQEFASRYFQLLSLTFSHIERCHTFFWGPSLHFVRISGVVCRPPKREDKTMTHQPSEPSTRRFPRLKRIAKWGSIVAVIVTALVAWVTYDEIRTLWSLRRIEGTNAYVMDYYGDYHLDHIRANGIDVNDIEGSFIKAYFPTPVAFAIQSVQSWYLPDKVELQDVAAHHCSTVVYQNADGETFFGRNFDWYHTASLVLRIHKGGKVVSTAVLDLAYLNMDRTDLDETSLVTRVPLLLAPYYLMDGANEAGVAVSDMSVEGVQPPHEPGKPALLHSTAMRMILDNCQSTQEAIDLLDEFNLRFAGTTCHLMIADASGDSAVVEFIGGEKKVSRTEPTWQVCTNSQIWGESEEACDENCYRYKSASDQLAQFADTKIESADIMNVMQSVSVNDWTMWSSVYNLSTDELLFVHRKGETELVPTRFSLAE